jgi:4-hydroxy-4-methyl-2-oxoglutarate aldolase
MPSGWVVDARGRRGALDHRIRPLLAGTPFVGSALTVSTVARDNLVPYAALQEAQPGDVLMIATGDYERAAVVGDLLVGMAKNCGIVAVITDGLVRDIAGLEDVGIPVYARGLTPNSPEKHGPGEIGLPIALGGEAINAGDLIVGDRDGIVVIPYADIDRVADGLAAVTAKEQKMEAAVRDGLKYPEWLEQTLQQKGVRYLDEQ